MIYFDNSATTKAHTEIIDTFVTVNENFWANPASIHEFGYHTNELLNLQENKLQKFYKHLVTKFISHLVEQNPIILAIFGLANKYKHRGNHVLISAIEHPSVLEAAKQLRHKGFEVEMIPVNKKGIILLEEVKKLLRERYCFSKCYACE